MHRDIKGLMQHVCAVGATFRCCGYLDSPGRLTWRPSSAPSVTVLKKTTGALPWPAGNFSAAFCSLSALLQSQPRRRIDLSKCSQSPLHAYIEARQRQQMCASAHLLRSCSAVHPHQVSQHTKDCLFRSSFLLLCRPSSIVDPAEAMICLLNLEQTASICTRVLQERNWNFLLPHCTGSTVALPDRGGHEASRGPFKGDPQVSKVAGQGGVTACKPRTKGCTSMQQTQ